MDIWFGIAFVVWCVVIICMIAWIIGAHSLSKFKGATAYEFEVLWINLRVCHLRGEFWAWRPWRRVMITYWYDDRDLLVRLLLRIGLVALRGNGTIAWPWSWPRWDIFVMYLRYGPRLYLFRNLRGVVKWVPGRLLPRRWGFGICGFEFGDRGH